MDKFTFEDLEVWQRAVELADKVIATVENIHSQRNHYRLIEQLEAAATSVAMNIAEGKGRYSKKEFVHFLYIARGSLFELVTLVKIFEKRNWITVDKSHALNRMAAELAKMLNSLISSIRSNDPKQAKC